MDVVSSNMHSILTSPIHALRSPRSHANERIWKKWETLSPREKDVAALVCLGHTNREIGACLNISGETVKDRLGTALKKFNLTKRIELRDFSEWERKQ